MSIFDNIKNAHDAVVLDLANGNPPTLGKKLSNAAVAAITSGINSPAGKAYMSLFADNLDQLERLTVAKANEDDYLPLFRAYIVSNSVCDVTTNTNTISRITAKIDDPTMKTESDGKVVKPFTIP
ncbi:MAG TPA: hypothetical protein VE961_06565 [Pyrinomonadaceae bacterium]|nr:hypothetical protein [Pyrinomonadaceae bacterium]